MKKKSTAPTMKDVAREAGVALGTVSKVVNGLPVGEIYKQRVEDAVNKLGYQVNSYAQGMKSDKTYTVALLIPNTVNPFLAELANYINIELQKRKYRMLLCTTDENPEMEQEYITMVRQNKVDGIIGLTYSDNLLINEDLPFVSIDRIINSSIPCVSSDNFAGGQMAAEKLADLGCHNVAFLRIGSSLSNEPNKRKAGFEKGCLKRNLKYTMKILDDSEPMEHFYSFFEEYMIDGKLEFDGLFCVTDYVAHYVMNILTRLHVRVPEDVQIIGFDGIRYFGDSEYICSTIVQPIPKLAEMCVELLFQENTQCKPPLVCLPVSYAYGGTTLESGQSVNNKVL
ncbi:MAG: LacI family DNA-binding transcriptional regulator [Lachnospiraceae bacterium]